MYPNAAKGTDIKNPTILMFSRGIFIISLNQERLMPKVLRPGVCPYFLTNSLVLKA